MRPSLPQTAVPFLLLGVLLAAPAPARAADFCQQTAQDVLKSCNTLAQGDQQLALAKCDNVSDAAARTACERQAAADAKDATADCQDQYDVRAAACERLGPAPYDPVIDPADFVSGVNNPFFPLRPGTTLVSEGATPDGFEHDEFAVTRATRVIDGVTCIEVRDRVWLDGELAEDTLDWFAQDRAGNVWYFGENTHELEDGLITTIDGSFLAGVDGAKPGIVMKAHPAVGDFYLQEFDLANAEDQAGTIALGETVRVRAGRFTGCLESEETTPLEPEANEHKFYAPGVGNILTVDTVTGARTELVRITTN
jgi:hypothetical protein